jgi:hypothetical protein
LYLAKAREDTGRYEVILREDAALLETSAPRKYGILIINADRRDPEFRFTQSQQEALWPGWPRGDIHGTARRRPRNHGSSLSSEKMVRARGIGERIPWFPRSCLKTGMDDANDLVRPESTKPTKREPRE